MGFNIHILSGRKPSQNLDVRAAVAASFNPVLRDGELLCAGRGSVCGVGTLQLFCKPPDEGLGSEPRVKLECIALVEVDS
jgi:hypothetical protein